MRKGFGTVARLGLLIALGAGCASPPPKFYTLSPAATAIPAAAGYAIAVGPVSVPAAVDRPQIVVRVGPNQVALDEFNRWAAPLPGEIARVVAENLAATLGAPRVTVFPKAAAPGAGYRVMIDVLRFDSAVGESADLDAVWTVRGPKDGPSRTGRTKASEAVPEKSYAALVAAHSRALSRLSADIAGAIRTLEGSGR